MPADKKLRIGVLGAANIAQLAAEAGIRNVVYVSAIGANATSDTREKLEKAKQLNL